MYLISNNRSERFHLHCNLNLTVTNNKNVMIINLNRYILCNRGYKTSIDNNQKDLVTIIKKKEEV